MEKKKRRREERQEEVTKNETRTNVSKQAEISER